MLLDDLKDPNDAKIAADRLMKALKAPFFLAGKEVFTSVSIGIAPSNPMYEEPEEILRDADTAMYHAKSLGKGRYEVFDARMRANVMARLQLDTDLRHALERGEFRNFYQPIVSLVTGEIAGFEACCAGSIRLADCWGPLNSSAWWKRPDLFANWAGGICARPAGKSANGARRPTANGNLTISVNLSAKQFLQPNLVADISNLLRELDVPARSFEDWKLPKAR